MINTQKISIDCLIIQSEGNIVSNMDGEKVMMSIHNGKYYNLGTPGSTIWDLIKTPISINQLITTLMSKYDVEKNECEKQVISFLERLYEEGLIRIVDRS
ncbi:lasso peptide biosynthesis PqqD family chaperone [Bacillus sp. FJAT-53711]|uniref:Lasso peptide biosynthesis PqqD family chaperone n=1 Tax=Bacillus yunxiaonensis TaxID=3127665 RepID=A0ABU8FXU9_9BACI